MVFADGEGSDGQAAGGAAGSLPCDALCEAAGSCAEPTCFADCQAAYQAGCPAEMDAWIWCQAELYDTATCRPGECPREQSQFGACAGTDACSESCDGSGGDVCGCTRSCAFRTQAVSCSQAPSGDILCECWENDALLGSCLEVDDFPCYFDAGCCSELF